MHGQSGTPLKPVFLFELFLFTNDGEVQEPIGTAKVFSNTDKTFDSYIGHEAIASFFHHLGFKLGFKDQLFKEAKRLGDKEIGLLREGCKLQIPLHKTSELTPPKLREKILALSRETDSKIENAESVHLLLSVNIVLLELNELILRQQNPLPAVEEKYRVLYREDGALIHL